MAVKKSSEPRNRMIPYALGAALCILLWIGLAFVWAIPNGWVHTPLVLGVLLSAIAILQNTRV